LNTAQEATPVPYAAPDGIRDLPALARALSADAMLTAFRRFLPPRDGSAWERCAIERVSYKPGKSARVLYRLWKEREPAASGRPHYYYSEFLPAARSLRRYVERRERGGAGAPTGFVAELDMIYWRFPADPRLAQLADVWREGNWSVVTYTPTMGGVLSGLWNGQPTIVKLYHDDRVEAVGRVMRALAAAGVSVPHVLDIDVARRLLVFEHVPGIGFWSDPDAHLRREVMAAMAGQLATLHDTSLPAAEQATLARPDLGAREWARFAEASAELAAAFPDLAPRLERLVTMLHAPYPVETPALLHGDFHPAQFLVHDATPRLIDFDNVCLGDPMYDMARFASHLYYKGQVHGRPLREIEQAVSSFRAAYLGAGSRFAPQRWFWHLAVSLVAKRAHRVLTRLEAGGAACAAHLVGIAEQNAASIVRR
jgi:aminoglycoside phosphotransferase (APT) family kinase protein